MYRSRAGEHYISNQSPVFFMLSKIELAALKVRK